MPATMPGVMLAVNGIKMIVRKAGIANLWSFHGMSAAEPIIKHPISTSAGHAAQAGTLRKTGIKGRLQRNNVAVTTEAKPVRAPLATPAMDSRKTTHGDPPRILLSIVANPTTMNVSLAS